MTKFKREITEDQKLIDRFINSFHKGGFVNEELFETNDRDIWPAYRDMLSVTTNTTLYNSILIGWKEVKYSEELIQEVTTGNMGSKDKFSNKVYAQPNPLNVRIMKCIYVRTPVQYGKDKKDSGGYAIVKPKKGLEIRNTLKRLEQFRNDYNIVESTEEFLRAQLVKNDLDLENINDVDTDLFLYNNSKDKSVSEKILLVPNLIDNMYYEDRGNKRYPYISEMYHYHKTLLNQIKFGVKESKQKMAYILETYFVTGKPVDFDKEIFLVKQYGKNFFNPLMFVEEHEAIDIINDLRNDKFVTPETLELAENTFEHFMRDIDERIEDFGNTIPNLTIESSSSTNLQYNKVEEVEEDIFSDEDGETMFKEVVDTNETENRSTLGYSTIDRKTIKSLIMGYNGKKFYNFYEHLNELFLRVFISSGQKSSRYNRAQVDTKNVPLPLQLIATINQNSNLFINNNMNNPLDVFMALSYKKYLFHIPKEGSNANQGVSPRERYLDYDTEYGYVDPISTKSETSSGLQSNVLIYKSIASSMRFRT